MRWQVYVHNPSKRAALVENLLKCDFEVYLWRNSNRVTFEGTPARITMFLLKHTIDGMLYKHNFPNPAESDLSYRISKLSKSLEIDYK